MKLTQAMCIALALLLCLSACAQQTPTGAAAQTTAAPAASYHPACYVTGQMRGAADDLPLLPDGGTDGNGSEAEVWRTVLRDMRGVATIEASAGHNRVGSFSTLIADQILQTLSTGFRGVTEDVSAADERPDAYTTTAEAILSGRGDYTTWALTALAADGTPLWAARYEDGVLTLCSPERESLRFSSDSEAMLSIGDLLWQAEQALLIQPAAVSASYRLLINDPVTELRCAVQSVLDAGETELALWENEWRGLVTDEAATAMLYFGNSDGISREGSLDDIRVLLNALSDCVHGAYTGASEPDGTPLFRAAAEGASGGVLWSVSYYGEYLVFSPNGTDGWRFAANTVVCDGLTEYLQAE